MLPAWRRLAGFALTAVMLAAPSRATAEEVDVYAAGSLRTLVTALHDRAAAMGMDVKATFGGSGSLREKIEKGATPDLLLSADMTSPIALATSGRAIIPPVAFAGNRLCLVARRSLDLTPANMVDKLLDSGVRIKTSEPVADPSGNYAMTMFDLMNRASPGAARILKAKATELQHASALSTSPDENPMTALFDAGLIDVAVTYCSGSEAIARAGKDLVGVQVPERFAPHPIFGLALLSAKSAAARFALLLLSQDGQAAVAKAGLIPLLGQPPSDQH
jgi:molybdate transport system substrate-binding protein